MPNEEFPQFRISGSFNNSNSLVEPNNRRSTNPYQHFKDNEEETLIQENDGINSLETINNNKKAFKNSNHYQV